MLKAKRFVSPENLLPGRMGYLVRRVKKRLGNITRKFLEEGFEGVANRVAFHYRWSREFHKRDAEFDRSLGVDTKGPVGLWYLRIESDNVRDAIRYEGVNPLIFRQALREVHDDFEGFTFVDLGCGKGRALLLANEFRFSQLIGVEFAPELAAVARSNCHRAAVQATVLSQDAAQFPFPAGNIVVYLYNPFGPTVLNPVLDHLLESRHAKCYIVYINPVHRQQCFDTRPHLQYVAGETGYAIWAVTAIH
ncbi:MAG TPA: class I SAM-dependent methyltransferase [Candidatus Acidoferrum sp.]|nr:class I SAM-dependent methyltransferase [Candidatus Acidoferrum sp.]